MPTKIIQIIQRHGAQTHKIGNNDVILAFGLQVITQERCTLLTVGALKTLKIPVTKHNHTHTLVTTPKGGCAKQPLI